MSQIIRRKEFLFLWTSPKQYKVVVAARGSGKTFATLQFVLERILTGEPNTRALFFASTLKQVKETVSPIMRTLLKDYPTSLYKHNRSDNTYRFFLGKNDVRELILLSYENPESKRGFHPQLIVLDECGLLPFDMFGTVIMPMLTDSSGQLIAIGTAKGHNKFYELFQFGLKRDYPAWESYCIKASNCHWFDSDFLWTQRNNMTAAAYAQEYECDFDANVLVGSVYGEFINRYTLPHIDDTYEWDPSLPVYTAWDLGWADYTALWFFQVKNDRVTFIDYYEDNGKDMSFYANFLNKKPYTYRTMILPHDGARGDMRGQPLIDQLSNLGFHCECLQIGLERDGIDEARRLLKTCCFNKTNCAVGLERLKTFKYKIDRKTGLKTNQTVHDESSHGADAFRYAAVSSSIWKNNTASGRIAGVMNYNVFNCG